jgi:hypothetical protein
MGVPTKESVLSLRFPFRSLTSSSHTSFLVTTHIHSLQNNMSDNEYGEDCEEPDFSSDHASLDPPEGITVSSLSRTVASLVTLPLQISSFTRAH